MRAFPHPYSALRAGVLALVLMAAFTQAQLVNNGDFEAVEEDMATGNTIATGWSYGGTPEKGVLVADSTEAHGGQYSLKLEALGLDSAEEAKAVTNLRAGSLPLGGEMTVSAWVKSDGVKWQLAYFAQDMGYAFLSWSTIAGSWQVAADDWTLIEKTVEVKAETAYPKLILLMENKDPLMQTMGTVWLDDVSIDAPMVGVRHSKANVAAGRVAGGRNAPARVVSIDGRTLGTQSAVDIRSQAAPGCYILEPQAARGAAVLPLGSAGN